MLTRWVLYTPLVPIIEFLYPCVGVGMSDVHAHLSVTIDFVLIPRLPPYYISFPVRGKLIIPRLIPAQQKELSAAEDKERERRLAANQDCASKNWQLRMRNL